MCFLLQLFNGNFETQKYTYGVLLYTNIGTKVETILSQYWDNGWPVYQTSVPTESFIARTMFFFMGDVMMIEKKVYQSV